MSRYLVNNYIERSYRIVTVVTSIVKKNNYSIDYISRYQAHPVLQRALDCRPAVCGLSQVYGKEVYETMQIYSLIPLDIEFECHID